MLVRKGASRYNHRASYGRCLAGLLNGGLKNPTGRRKAVMTVFEALMIALTLGLLIVAMMDKSNKHNKK
jgi:hypothetical protein